MKETTIHIGNQEHHIIAGHATNKRHSKNPLKNKLLSLFDSQLKEFIAELRPERILEIGCGEGYVVELVKQMLPKSYYVAVDIDEELLAAAQQKGANEICLSQVEPITLPYQDEMFDLVLMIEVLEHLILPEQALQEAARLTKSHLIASVPHEPIWRIVNILQLKDLRAWGNTPGHLNHWSKTQFCKFLLPCFELKDVMTPFPWIMALARKKTFL